jgi:ankyrin repeat protein
VAILQYLRTRYPKYAASKPVSSKALDSAFRKGLLSQIKAYAKRTPLPVDSIAIASYYGQNKILLFCLSQGLDIEEAGIFGSPLRAASLQGHVNTVRILIDQGADVNIGGTFGDPLQAASMHGNVLVAEILLKHGANINSSGGYYGTALQAAAYRGHEDVTNLLISNGTSIYQSGLFKDAFCAAVAAGHSRIIDLLIQNGYSGQLRDDFESSRRWYCSASNRSPTVSGRRLLLEDSLIMAFNEEQVHLEGSQIPRELHHSGNSSDLIKSALLGAALCGTSGVVQSLVESRDKLRVTLEPTLLLACEKGHVELVSIILQNIDVPTLILQDSLDRAAWHGNEETVVILLNQEDIHGQPPSLDFRPYSKGNDSHRTTNIPVKRYWTDYFYPTTKHTHINETYTNGHIVRILLQGCRGDQPTSVALALQLAPNFGLRNMLEASFLQAAACDSVRVLDHLMGLCQADLLPLVPSGYKAAIKHGALSSLAFMMKHHGGPIPRTAQLPIFVETAINRGNAEALRQFLLQGLYDPKLLLSGFIRAAQYGHVSVLQVLYEQKDKVQYLDFNLVEALDRAAAHGHRSSVEYLVQQGADLNAMADAPGAGREAFRSFGHFMNRSAPRSLVLEVSSLRSCLQACFDPIFMRLIASLYISDDKLHDFNVETSRVISKQEDILEFLMRHGASTSATDVLGRSILHWAAATCSANTVRAIVECGCSIHTCDSEGMSPLAYAATRELNSLCVFNTLLELQHANGKSKSTPNCVQLLALALEYFKAEPHGTFYESWSVYDVLNTSPGAVVKRLLHLEPELEAVGDGFGLLLQMVAVCGDNDFLALLVDRGVDVNNEGYHYVNALEAAARFGRLECVRLLLHAGANVNHGRKPDPHEKRVHKRSCSPLHAAVLSGHLGTVSLILDAGVDLKLRDYSCVLKTALSSGSAVLVQLLVSKASANWTEGIAEQSKGISSGLPKDVMVVACRVGSKRLVELLLGLDADPWPALFYYLGKQKPSRYSRESHQNHLESPVTTRETNHIQLLLKSVTKLPDRDFSRIRVAGYTTPETWAMPIGKFIVRRLVGTHHFVPFCVNNAEFVRAWSEDEDIILDVLALPKTSDLLLHASLLGAQRCIDILLNAGIGIESTLEEGESSLLRGEQAIHLAAIFGKYRAVEQLLCRGADPHTLSSKLGSVPWAIMQSACKWPVFNTAGELSLDRFSYGSKQIPEDEIEVACSLVIRIMRNNSMDTQMVFHESDSLLYYASYLGSRPLIDFCLDRGMDVNQIGPYGPPLAAAIEGNTAQITEYLLSRGANMSTAWTVDVNTSWARQYESLVHFACERLQVKVSSSLHDFSQGQNQSKVNEMRLLDQIETLLHAGADANFRSPSFGTYMHYASKIPNMSLIALLSRYGADPNVIDSGGQSPLTVLVARTDTWGSDDHLTEHYLREFLYHAPTVQVRLDDVVLALKSSRWHHQCPRRYASIIQMLLEHSRTITIDASLVDMASNHPKGLSLLLDKAPNLRLSTDQIVSGWEDNRQSFELLIHHQLRFYSPDELFNIFPANNIYFARGVIILLQEDSTYCPPVATISTLLDMPWHYAWLAVELMFDQSSHVTVTASMLTQAVNADNDPRRRLENTYRLGELEDYCMRNGGHVVRHRETRLQLLLDHDKHCKIPEELIQLCQERGYHDSMKTLRGHDSST